MSIVRNILDKIKKRPLQFFLLKTVFLFLVLFVIDYSLGTVLRYFYFRQQSGELYRITYSLEKTNEDVLIFGSSRANHHYHPDVFENSMHLSCYNTGRDGEHIFYQYAILKGVLKRYTPKIVIFDFITAEFIKEHEGYERLSALLPYYHDHPEIRSIIKLRGPYEKYKLLSRTYPYNSVIFQVALGNTEYKKAKHEDINGYLPITNEWDEPIKTVTYPESYPIDSIKVSMFESVIKDCIHAGTRLCFVCSPYFFVAKNEDYSVVLAKKMAKEYNIDFFDFSTDTTFTSHADLFNDFAHLNDKGARIFTKKVIDCIGYKEEMKPTTTIQSTLSRVRRPKLQLEEKSIKSVSTRVNSAAHSLPGHRLLFPCI